MTKLKHSLNTTGSRNLTVPRFFTRSRNLLVPRFFTAAGATLHPLLSTAGTQRRSALRPRSAEYAAVMEGKQLQSSEPSANEAARTQNQYHVSVFPRLLLKDTLALFVRLMSLFRRFFYSMVQDTMPFSSDRRCVFSPPTDCLPLRECARDNVFCP